MVKFKYLNFHKRKIASETVDTIWYAYGGQKQKKYDDKDIVS